MLESYFSLNPLHAVAVQAPGAKPTPDEARQRLAKVVRFPSAKKII